jgi:hypothetical protein
MSFGQTVLLPSFRRDWGRWSAPTRGVKFCINKSKSALHIPQFPTEHASFRYGACLLSLRSMLPVVVGLCFRTRGAMLLDTESYAFGIGKLCFWGRGVMLFTSGSYAFRCYESFRGGCWVILIWHVTSFFMAVALVFSGSCYPCRIAFSNALQSYEKFPRYAISIGKISRILTFIITLHFNRFPLYKF